MATPTPLGYLFEAEDIARLRRVADRLGDTRTLSHDERRDLMNLLCLIISHGQPIVEPATQPATATRSTGGAPE